MDSRLIFLHFVLKVMEGQRKLGLVHVIVSGSKYVGSKYKKICIYVDLRYDGCGNALD